MGADNYRKPNESSNQPVPSLSRAHPREGIIQESFWRGTTSAGPWPSEFSRGRIKSQQARQASGEDSLTALADCCYFESEHIPECEQSGIEALVPKPLTFNSRAAGRFDKRDFIYIAHAPESLRWR